MIKLDKHTYKNGVVKTQVRIVDGYRNENDEPRQRTIESFGYLEDKENPDEFLAALREYDKKRIKEKRVNITKASTLPFYEDDGSTVYHFGYKYLEAIYNELKLDEMFNKIDSKCKYNIAEIFKFLVIQRILLPDSKRATYQRIENLYGKKYDLSLHQLYRSLAIFGDASNDIQRILNDEIKSLVGRDTSNVFFDSTNYYFQKDLESEDQYEEVCPLVTGKTNIKNQKIIEVTDEEGNYKQFKAIPGLMKRGVSKEHVVDPIIQMGLLMDKNGIPICMQVFPGNTSDSLTLLPILNEAKGSFGLGRTVVVADKGMNTTKNIDTVVNNGDGFMFSQILKGKKGKRYQDRIFDESLYTVVDEDYRYQEFIEDYDATDLDGNRVVRKRKVLIYYNGATARREKNKRDEKVAKAKKSLTNNAYMVSHGYDKYLVEESYVENTGEIADKKSYKINKEKIKEEEKYDGMFAIITSELDYDQAKIRETYHGLWRIEESFRVTKSELELRPIYVTNEKHIKGHFIICFVALCVLRILQKKMNYSISIERIVRALNMCKCTEIVNGVIHVLKDDTTKQFVKKISQDKKIEYTSEELDKILSETVEDYKLIIKEFNSKLCTSLITKSDFESFLKSIKLKK